ncbi:MAG: hypothetical protein AAFW75_07675 [Cyanobacteria bacterium J06636_16]
MEPIDSVILKWRSDGVEPGVGDFHAVRDRIKSRVANRSHHAD